MSGKASAVSCCGNMVLVLPVLSLMQGSKVMKLRKVKGVCAIACPLFQLDVDRRTKRVYKVEALYPYLVPTDVSTHHHHPAQDVHLYAILRRLSAIPRHRSDGVQQCIPRQVLSPPNNHRRNAARFCTAITPASTPNSTVRARVADCIAAHERAGNRGSQSLNRRAQETNRGARAGTTVGGSVDGGAS